jgi:signal transduction histidine kinase
MEIKKKLTYQFIAIAAFILLFASLAIYFSFSQTRREEFYDRLSSKAKLVAQMLIEIDEIDTELLKKIEKNNPLSLPNEKIIIYDYQNEKIYSNDENNELLITIDLINEARLKDDIRIRQKPYEILGLFYTGQYDRIIVFTAATDIFGLQKLKRLRVILLIVFIASLFIVFFAGRVFAARALSPISNIITQVDGISISNLNERVNEGNGTDEIAQLAKTFNKMLQRLETSFKIQKNFIANASHELRTPLTVLTGQLEVVLMKARNNSEYKETLTSVLEDIKNLNQISNRLLLLAQASSELTEADFSIIRLDDIIWQARNEILKRNKAYTININFDEKIDDEDKLTIYGNDLLIKTAISNLMDNACKYSENNKVEIYLNSLDKKIIIQFKDKGIGIPKEDLKMVFQPFYRGKNAMNIKGHGIGLSLVEKIIHQHKGDIDVKSEQDKGSVFTISIPVYNKLKSFIHN